MSPQPQNLEPTSSIVQLTPPIFSIVQSLDSLVKDTHLGPGCCNIFVLSIDHYSDFDHCPDWAGLMSTLRDSSAWSERLRRRVLASDTVPPPEHIEPEVEPLSDEESSDDIPDEAPVAVDTPENRSKEQRYAESRNVIKLKISDNLSDVRRIVTGAGLIHTLTDIDPYQPNVVRDFIANLPEAEERDDGVAVYVRGSLVDFSPSLINSLYSIPGFEEDPNWMDENIDEVLYKLVSSNWIPTMNYTSMNQKRLRFVYMLHHNDGFDFGKLVYDQIMAMAGNTTTEKTRCIMFPTLIHQVILFQRNIPPDTLNDEFTGTPKLAVKDIKAGRGSGADSSAASLEEDINHTIAGLKIEVNRLRLKKLEQELCSLELKKYE
ncbi:hypothetical protein DY000_02013505 [Brassica cretica]|uniref:Putative plant transposon protein domain-containing protein n=1 Tax=Brassica cretica TaxID=69181 RepID=A0ABQ7CRP6_BRACR|nr:hypothetical protein DY000_02013505 [Brassica cretica]